MLPLAHVGHYLWVLYLPPILIVAGSIVRSKLLEHRQSRDQAESQEPPVTPPGGGPKT
jgi:hypothetical protein